MSMDDIRRRCLYTAICAVLAPGLLLFLIGLVATCMDIGLDGKLIFDAMVFLSAFSISNGLIGGIVFDPAPLSSSFRAIILSMVVIACPFYLHLMDLMEGPVGGPPTLTLFGRSVCTLVCVLHANGVALLRAAHLVYFLKRYQLSIGGLMSATAVVSIALAVATRCLATAAPGEVHSIGTTAAFLALLVSSVSMLSPWMFQHRNLGWRILGVMLALGLFSIIVPAGIMFVVLGLPFFLQIFVMQLYVQCSPYFDRFDWPNLHLPATYANANEH